jgi:S1-C subfamily serine protease
MDTPETPTPASDDPASQPTDPSMATPVPADEVGYRPAAPIALGPVAGSWPPPPPVPPSLPPTAGPGPDAWAPFSTPYGLAWGPLPIPPAPTVTRRHRHLVPILGVAVVMSLLLGLGVGYAVWRPGGTSSTNVAANKGGSSSQGSHSFTYPFGGGSATTTPSGGTSSGSGDSAAIAAKVTPGLVDINVTLSYQGESAAGTGQVLTSSGLVLTNNHVIDGATTISAVDLGNGKTYSASVVGYDRTGDLAVIQLHGASGLSTVTIGNSSKVAVGQSIVAVGNAGGVGGAPSVAAGSVTTLNQGITASDDNGGNSEQLSGLIEVNANIEPGDSGGPLVDTDGVVVGIDTAASATSTFSSSGGDGYAIPINTAMTIVKQIEQGKGSSTVHVGATALLGVIVAPSLSDCSDSSGLGGLGGLGGVGGSTTSGATVCGTASGSPAVGAGLVEGDVITSVGGQTVTTAESLSTIIAAHHPGDSVPVMWTDTAGASHTATVQLISGPAT